MPPDNAQNGRGVYTGIGTPLMSFDEFHEASELIRNWSLPDGVPLFNTAHALPTQPANMFTEIIISFRNGIYRVDCMQYGDSIVSREIFESHDEATSYARNVSALNGEVTITDITSEEYKPRKRIDSRVKLPAIGRTRYDRRMRHELMRRTEDVMKEDEFAPTLPDHISDEVTQKPVAPPLHRRRFNGFQVVQAPF